MVERSLSFHQSHGPSDMAYDLDLGFKAWPLERDPSPTRGQAVNMRGVNWVVSGRSVSQPTNASVFPSPVTKVEQSDTKEGDGML